jgi:hypothetical protein
MRTMISLKRPIFTAVPVLILASLTHCSRPNRHYADGGAGAAGSGTAGHDGGMSGTDRVDLSGARPVVSGGGSTGGGEPSPGGVGGVGLSGAGPVASGGTEGNAGKGESSPGGTDAGGSVNPQKDAGSPSAGEAGTGGGGSTAPDCGACPSGALCVHGACACPDGMHVCDSACVDSDSADHCGTACSPCQKPTGGGATCDGTSCHPTCPSGQPPCAGTCIAEGTPCTEACGSGTHDCGGVCSLDTDVTACGIDCAPCAQPANSDANCTSGECGFTCRDGYRPCGSGCIASSSCCDDGECTTLPETTCSSSTLTAYSTGSCSEGSCVYPPINTRCGGGCQSSGAACAHDAWNPEAVAVSGAPAGRSGHVAVWADNVQRMIVWGGAEGGGQYDPATNTWSAISTTDAPAAAIDATAVWTGQEMIVWGGTEISNYQPVNTGGSYNPETDTWAPLPTTDAPTARTNHAAVWDATDKQMLVAGGWDGSTVLGGFYVYDWTSKTWTSWTSAGDPYAMRYGHTAIWTGTDMIIWGGTDASGNHLDTGTRFAPGAQLVLGISTTSAPEGRTFASAVWTGSEMIVWGGRDDSGALADGGRYDPSTDSWQPLPDITLEGRYEHTAIWTGSEMIVWGGGPFSPNTDPDGARYSPSTDQWSGVSTTDRPSGRRAHTAVWTGIEMIVWGGYDPMSATFYTGGRYAP